MMLVGQSTDETRSGCLFLEHLVKVEIGRRTELGGAALGLLSGPTDDRDQFGVGCV